MNEGYALLYTKLIDNLSNNPLVNLVTEGLTDEIDLGKQTIFPLAHVVINSATFQNNAVSFQVDIYCMDIVDISDDGIDNKKDVMNTQYNILLRLYEDLRRGTLWNDDIEIESMSVTAFEQAYENYLAGWSASLSILVPNHMTIC
jgi:hypothetical protein